LSLVIDRPKPGAELLLYTTSGCHLCEKAKTALWPVLSLYELRLREVDIAESDALIERYGMRIPVVALADRPGELDWPFTSEQVAHLVCSPD
jgi:hypothetical protein